MDEVDDKRIPPECREDFSTDYFSSEESFQSVFSVQNMGNAISDEEKAEPWKNGIVISGKEERILESQHEKIIIVHSYRIEEYPDSCDKSSDKDIFCSKPDEKWRQEERERKKVDNPENDAIFPKKSEGNEGDDDGNDSEEDSPLQRKNTNFASCLVLRKKKQGYAGYEYKWQDHRFS